MSIITFISLIQIFPCNLNAQMSIESHFNNISTDNNQTLNFNYQLKHLEVFGGIKYHFNKLDNFPTSVFYYKTAWTTKFHERFGFNIGLERLIYQNDYFDLSFYYQGFYTKSMLRHKMYYAIGSLVPEPQSEEDIVYVKEDRIFGPFIGFENNIGIEFTFPLFEKLFFNLRIGGGYYKPINLSKNVFIGGGNTGNLSRQFSFGLKYHFKNAHNNK